MTEKELLLTSVLGCRRVDLYAQPITLTPAQEAQLAQMTARLEQDEPVQYILGECEFMGLRFKVDKRVLIPRPETELLVEAVIETLKQNQVVAPRILDLGTGSGNIAVSLAKLIPESFVVSADVSQEALVVAQENAELNGVGQRTKFVNADMRDLLKNTNEIFDVIVSNPPYVRRDQLAVLPRNVHYEPAVAIDGGGDGLDFYRVIVSFVPKVLRPNGYLFFEIGDGQRRGLEEIFAQDNSFKQIKLIKDYFQTDRIVSATFSQ